MVTEERKKRTPRTTVQQKWLTALETQITNASIEQLDDYLLKTKKKLKQTNWRIKAIDRIELAGLFALMFGHVAVAVVFPALVFLALVSLPFIPVLWIIGVETIKNGLEQKCVSIVGVRRKIRLMHSLAAHKVEKQKSTAHAKLAKQKQIDKIATDRSVQAIKDIAVQISQEKSETLSLVERGLKNAFAANKLEIGLVMPVAERGSMVMRVANVSVPEASVQANGLMVWTVKATVLLFKDGDLRDEKNPVVGEVFASLPSVPLTLTIPAERVAGSGRPKSGMPFKIGSFFLR